MSLWSERYWPYWAAVAVAIVAVGIAIWHGLGSLPRELTISGITIGVVIAGFTATQRNMLLGMSGAKILQIAADSGYYQDVIRYMRECLFVALAVTVVSILSSTFDFFFPGWVISSIWAGLVTLLFGIIARNERLMFNVFERFLETQKSGQNGSFISKNMPHESYKQE